MSIKTKNTKKSGHKIKVSDVREIEFKYFKFNFSFINQTYSLKNLEPKHKAELIDRIEFLSSKPITEIGILNKKLGYELIDRKMFKKNVEVPSEFHDSSYRSKKSNDKYIVIRLYPNNNPLPVRLIGKFCSPIFYVIYIDRNHELLS